MTDILYNIDMNPPDNEPVLEFIAEEIVITGKYSLNLIKFKVEIDKYTVAELKQGEI